MTETDERYVLFTADCHIKRRTWTNSTILQGDATKAMSKLFGASAGKADTVLIGGDLFDSNRPTSMDLLDVKLYSQYKFREMIYIRGNHDSVEPSFVEAIAEDNSDLVTKVLEVGDWMFTDELMSRFVPLALGRAFVGKEEGISYVAGVPYIHNTEMLLSYIRAIIDRWLEIRKRGNDVLYLMLHSSFKELLGFDGAYQLSVPIIKELCGDELINILVGHIHTRATFVYNDNGAFIHSPGSLYPLSTSDMGDHFFGTLINLDNMTLEDVPCDVRKYAKLHATKAADLTKLEEWLDESGYAPDKGYLPTFIKLVLNSDFEGAIATPNPDKYVIQVVREEKANANAPLRATQYTLQEAVAEELAADPNHEMLMDMANALMQSDDQVALLSEWTKGWGVRKVT